MTKWIILSNPNMYDAIGAFRALKQVDWRQNINAEVGDTAFIYVARPVKAIRLKCNVITVDLPSPKIEDSQFNVNGESFDDHKKLLTTRIILHREKTKNNFRIKKDPEAIFITPGSFMLSYRLITLLPS